MPAKGLVTLDETLIRALTDRSLIVPNRRLQQACSDAFDRHEMKLGHRAWRAANVSTIGDHLEASFHLALDHGMTGADLLLRSNAERALWLRTAPAQAGDRPDLLVDGVMQAWQLAHHWQLWPGFASAIRTESHAMFEAWARRFRNETAQLRAITIAELPAQLHEWCGPDHRWLPKQIVTYGFEQTPRAIRALWDGYRRANVDVLQYSRDNAAQAVPRAEVFPTIELELRAAVAWAREVVANARQRGEEEMTRIGIVIADVPARHASITRQLDAVLTPGDIDPDPRRSSYNVSGGIPLADTLVARDALDLLALATSKLHYTNVHRLLHSPSAGVLTTAADLLTYRLPERFDLATFARMTRSPRLTRLSDLVREWPARARMRGWLEHFRDYLRACGWRTDASVDDELAANYAAVDESFERWSALGVLQLDWTPAEALDELRREFERALYAPRRPDAPIQVLGYLESAGLEFSHLWVAGLDALSWPAAPRPNPYLPLALQRSAGMPRCDTDAERAFALATTARWRSNATHVHFSCARDHVDETRSPSALVNGWREANSLEAIRWPHPFYDRRTDAVRQPMDDGAAPVGAAAVSRRGSGVLADQYACPFKAFARHRLAVDSSRAPHTFPDAIDRGNLVHRTLELAAAAHIGDRLAHVDVRPYVEDALAEWQRFSSRVRDTERVRLLRVVGALLELESRRAPHCIESAEAATTLELGGIDFKLRIDRIDRTNSGVVVIDYKTSQVRPDRIGVSEPQLPMYALALADAVAVVYAQIREDRVMLRGIAASPDLQADEPDIVIDGPRALGADSWQGLRDQWRQTLTALARDFVDGVASVAPVDPRECVNCGLHALCRIRKGAPTDE